MRSANQGTLPPHSDGASCDAHQRHHVIFRSRLVPEAQRVSVRTRPTVGARLRVAARPAAVEAAVAVPRLPPPLSAPQWS